jgi:hypothetical protein
MRWMYFFYGTELSIAFRQASLRDGFYLCSQLFTSLALWFWWRAETLKGKCLHKNVGKDLVSLESPWTTFLASSSACSFLGLKSWCPGTQWICRLITPLFLPSQLLLASIALTLSSWLIRQSCLVLSCSASL